MTAVLEQRTSSVNRINPDAFPVEGVPVFPAFTAITSSETGATWSRSADTALTASETNPCNGIIRWYEPVTGRWLSNDPIGISGGLNQYQAFKSNPVNFRDPSGLCTETFGHAYSRNYDKILANLYGADLEWADLLGFWGIGALAAEVVVDASVSVVEAMAAEQVINSRIAGAMQGGDIFARTAAAEAGAQVGARTVILQSAMRGVGAATGVVGFGATGYSAGARLNAATRSIIQTIQERRRRP